MSSETGGCPLLVPYMRVRTAIDTATIETRLAADEAEMATCTPLSM
jgi:hypothetical protein